jgi:hypothetical protein
MADGTGAGERVSMVVVDDQDGRAMVPVDARGHLLARPGGSVTLEGIRRAARQVREEQDGRNIGSIAEATLSSVESRHGRWSVRRDGDA